MLERIRGDTVTDQRQCSVVRIRAQESWDWSQWSQWRPGCGCYSLLPAPLTHSLRAAAGPIRDEDCSRQRQCCTTLLQSETRLRIKNKTVSVTPCNAANATLISVKERVDITHVMITHSRGILSELLLFEDHWSQLTLCFPSLLPPHYRALMIKTTRSWSIEHLKY